jgi:adenine-specific DNA-methyltransferase
MFKPAGPDEITRARALRNRPTEWERRLWRRLREFNRRGCHFRRQAPFDRYVLDFVEHEAKLAIELDGSQHGEPNHRARDSARDAFLAGQGYVTLRFWNSDLFENFDGVMDQIERMLAKRGKVIEKGNVECR